MADSLKENLKSQFHLNAIAMEVEADPKSYAHELLMLRDQNAKLQSELTAARDENERLLAANRDLQYWFDDARDESERLRLHSEGYSQCESHDPVSTPHCPICLLHERDRLRSELGAKRDDSHILIKQAEAVEALASEIQESDRYGKKEFMRGMATAYGYATGYAQRLRQQADEADQ